jgi:uncharacterized protein (TIGR02246 family)
MSLQAAKLGGSVLLAVALIACGEGAAQADSTAAPPAAGTTAQPVDIAAEAQAIRTLSQQWLAAHRRKDVNGVLANYADDAVAVYGGTLLTGAAAIRKNLEDEFAKIARERPDYTPSWATTAVHVAPGGEMAYETGTYEDLWNERRSREGGHFVTVYRKVGGQWKVAHDMTTPAATSRPAGAPTQ